MKTLAQKLSDYELEHSASANKMTYLVAIPAIALGTLLLLSWISISLFASIHITFAWIASIALVVYFYFLDKKLAAALAIVLLIVTGICSLIAYPHPNGLSLILFLILFVGGWAMLFLTNSISKSKHGVMQIVMTFPIAIMSLVIKLIHLAKMDSYFITPAPTPTHHTTSNHRKQD